MTREHTTRISVTFSHEAVHWLETEADRRASTLADLVRRIVDETRGSYVVPRHLIERPSEGQHRFTYKKFDEELPKT
jgi:hypothetical protein